jgi:D-alanine-D-alanine ligase
MMTKINPQDFGKVVVLMGGESAEREVSLVSGNNILNALKRSGIDVEGLDTRDQTVEQLLKMNPDRAFIALHGAGGEDGTIQGLLEYMAIPYTGSGVTASGVTMDKSLCKLIWQSTGIPTPPFRLVNDLESAIHAMEFFGFPICVKPVNDGSSLGVTKVTLPEQLANAFEKACSYAYNKKIMIEPWIEGVEYTVGILGTESLPVIEIRTPRTFYDYEAKYNEDSTHFLCPCQLLPEQEQALQELAFRAFSVVGCSGWGRLDLVADVFGNYWFLEINTVPGMTPHSLLPIAAKVMGLGFDELVLEILSSTLIQERLSLLPSGSPVTVKTGAY